MATLAAWAFPSSSGSTTYETILTDAGELSCNCPGYVFKRKDTQRACRHTKQIDPYSDRLMSGSLTAEQVAVWLGVAAAPQNGAQTPAPVRQTSSQSASSAAPPASGNRGRRFDFEE